MTNPADLINTKVNIEEILFVEAENIKLKKLLNESLEMLKNASDYSFDTGNDSFYEDLCIDCGNKKQYGYSHNKHCKLMKLIKKIEEAK